MKTQYVTSVQTSTRYDYDALVAEARARWQQIEALDLLDEEAAAYTAWLEAMQDEAVARGECPPEDD